MEISDRQELVYEAHYALKKILNDKKEGLSFVNAIVNGNDVEYKGINGFSAYSKKYGLKSLLEGISYELNDYMEKCDRLSFDGKNRDFRSYFVRPYLSDSAFDLLEEVIDYTCYVYGFDSYVLWVKHGARRKPVKIENGIRRRLDDITGAFYSYDFVSALEESVSKFDTDTLEEHKKL